MLSQLPYSLGNALHLHPFSAIYKIAFIKSKLLIFTFPRCTGKYFSTRLYCSCDIFISLLYHIYNLVSTDSKKLLSKDERRIEELDRLFKRLYEDNVLGKIDDERFSQMSADYTGEQRRLREETAKLRTLIDEKEQKNSDISHFLEIVRKYEHVPELTPKLMHEFVEKIVVHEADKYSGHREQEVEIYFRFNVYVATITLNSR